MKLVEKAMMAERSLVFRLAMLFDIATAGHEDAVKRSKLRGNQGAVRKLPHPHNEVEPFGDGISQPLGKIQLDM